MSETLEPTENVETEEDLLCTICWNDDDDPEAELAAGHYKCKYGWGFQTSARGASRI